MQIDSVDEFVDKYAPQPKYRNKNPLAPQWPFRALFIAPSGGGKTTVVVNMIMRYLEFDRIYIYVKDLEEPKYQVLIAFFTAMQEKLREANDDPDEQIIWYSDDAADLVPLEELDPSKQNLIIFDDQVTDKHANEAIADYFVRSRKRNASLIYQTQSLFNVPKLLRLNCNYVMLFSVGNRREMRTIADTYATSITFPTFMELYAQCIAKPYGFMMLDTVTTKAPLKIRCGFDDLYIAPRDTIVSDVDTGARLKAPPGLASEADA
jgi:hypothetical protein